MVLHNKGYINITAWIVGTVGFVSTYFIWVICSPLVVQLVSAGNNMALASEAYAKFPFIQDMYDYAMVINAGVWLLYIILSSIFVEVVDNEYPISPY